MSKDHLRGEKKLKTGMAMSLSGEATDGNCNTRGAARKSSTNAIVVINDDYCVGDNDINNNE